MNENILKDVNPIRALTGEDQKQLKERIDSYREEDAQIFALFGHKFFDLFLYDESPAFENMCDWIDTTLGIFQDRDDLLILKPHPAEFSDVDHNPAPNETLADYVEGKIEQYSNILLLEPRDVSAAALYSEIDCGLVWTSSVGLEMACFGIPMIVSGSARYRSYVDLPYTKSKSQYRKQIKRASSIIIQPRVQTNASIYLHFEKNYRHIHCPYVKNVNYKKFRADQLEWNKEAVNEFLEIGHPQLEESIMTELTIPKQK